MRPPGRARLDARARGWPGRAAAPALVAIAEPDAGRREAAARAAGLDASAVFADWRDLIAARCADARRARRSAGARRSSRRRPPRRPGWPCWSRSRPAGTSPARPPWRASVPPRPSGSAAASTPSGGSCARPRRGRLGRGRWSSGIAYRRSAWAPHTVSDDALADLGSHAADLTAWIGGGPVARARCAVLRPDAAEGELELAEGRGSARFAVAQGRPYAELGRLGGGGPTVRRGGGWRNALARLGAGPDASALVRSLTAELAAFASRARRRGRRGPGERRGRRALPRGARGAACLCRSRRGMGRGYAGGGTPMIAVVSLDACRRPAPSGCSARAACRCSPACASALRCSRWPTWTGSSCCTAPSSSRCQRAGGRREPGASTPSSGTAPRSASSPDLRPVEHSVWCAASEAGKRVVLIDPYEGHAGGQGRRGGAVRVAAPQPGDAAPPRPARGAGGRAAPRARRLGHARRGLRPSQPADAAADGDHAVRGVRARRHSGGAARRSSATRPALVPSDRRPRGRTPVLGQLPGGRRQDARGRGTGRRAGRLLRADRRGSRSHRGGGGRRRHVARHCRLLAWARTPAAAT